MKVKVSLPLLKLKAKTIVSHDEPCFLETEIIQKNVLIRLFIDFIASMLKTFNIYDFCNVLVVNLIFFDEHRL